MKPRNIIFIIIIFLGLSGNSIALSPSDIGGYVYTTNPSWHSVPGVTVYLFDDSNNLIATTQSNYNGIYRFYGTYFEPNNEYHLYAEKDGITSDIIIVCEECWYFSSINGCNFGYLTPFFEGAQYPDIFIDIYYDPQSSQPPQPDWGDASTPSSIVLQVGHNGVWGGPGLVRAEKPLDYHGAWFAGSNEFWVTGTGGQAVYNFHLYSDGAELEYYPLGVYYGIEDERRWPYPPVEFYRAEKNGVVSPHVVYAYVDPVLNYTTNVTVPAVAYENETVAFTISVEGTPNTTRVYYSGGQPATLDVPHVGVFCSWAGWLANLSAESGEYTVQVEFAEPGTYLVAASNAETYAEVHVLAGPRPTTTAVTTITTSTGTVTTTAQQTTVSTGTTATTTATPPDGGPDVGLIIGTLVFVAAVVALVWYLRRTGRAV